MIRQNRAWDLGEPELNDRGQPVIHDIAARLGCIWPSLGRGFAEGANGAEASADLLTRFQEADSEMNGKYIEREKLIRPSPSSPPLARTGQVGRASSTESGHSTMSRPYSQNLSAQQQRKWQIDSKVKAPLLNPLVDANQSVLQCDFDSDLVFSDIDAAAPSSLYTDYLTRSPMLSEWSPLPSWTTTGDHLGQHNTPDLWAQFMMAPRYPELSDTNIDEILVEPMDLVEPSMFSVTDGIIMW
jgi:hypothetical protein